jgi:uncharacterized repeat protein (TIGR03847 family)
MADSIELDDLDNLGAGAVGEPGEREFFIQARSSATSLTVLLEKEQVALLAAEAVAFLDRIAGDYPEEPADPGAPGGGLEQPTVPLFRARLIGLGFDPDRELVLIELRERAGDDEGGEDASAGDAPAPPESESEGEGEGEGYVARIYATRSQVRAMAARGAAAVVAGRPRCPLCDLPMDASGHRCPRWN